MDPVNRRRIVDLVKKLGREGRTVLVSSHILHEVEAMTRRVLLIHHGRILAEGDVREIRDLMDEHPHTVALRARDPRALARAVVGSPHVLSLSFGAEGEWLTVQTGIGSKGRPVLLLDVPFALLMVAVSERGARGKVGASIVSVTVPSGRSRTHTFRPSGIGCPATRASRMFRLR